MSTTVTAQSNALTPAQVEQTTAQKLKQDLNSGASQATLSADYYTGLNAFNQADPSGSTADFAGGTLGFLPASVSNDQDLFTQLKSALSDVQHNNDTDFFNTNPQFISGTNLVVPNG